MKSLLFCWCAFLLVLVQACGGKKENNILSPETMQAVLWDVLQADAFTQNYIKAKGSKNDSIENAGLQQKIFQLHKISRQDFYNSYNYYAARPEEIRRILDSISARGERDRSKIMQERYGGTKPALDTVL